MKVLALLAPLDGAGRTTLAGGLALAAERGGQGPVVLIDADPAGTLGRRAAAAGQAPMAAVWDASCSGDGFDRLAAAGIGTLLVDTPVPPDPILGQVLARCDFAAVIVRPNEHDFTSLGPLLDALQAADRPFAFVVNRSPEGGLMPTATAMALANYGPLCPVVMPERREFAKRDEAAAPGALWPETDATPDSELTRLWGYLADRLAAAPAGARSPGAERRRHVRHAFDMAATFTWEAQVYPCRIQDISAGGLAIRSSVPLPLGARLMVHVPYLGEFEAEPVRADGAIAGLRFVIDEWRQAGLVRDLKRLVNAGRGAAPAAAEEASESGAA